MNGARKRCPLKRGVCLLEGKMLGIYANEAWKICPFKRGVHLCEVENVRHICKWRLENMST